MMKKEDLIKVFVRLERDEDGYPPVDWEELWAADVGKGKYQIDNIPFYAKLLAYRDTVNAQDRDGRLVVTGVSQSAGHSTIRVIAFTENIVPEIRAELRAIGCASELSNIRTFFAVDIPPEVDYSDAMKLIESHSRNGSIDYEESAIRHQ